MLYRYRLNRLEQRNRELKSRVVQGVRLTLHGWHYSRKKLFSSYSGIVDEQSAEEITGFSDPLNDVVEVELKSLDKQKKADLQRIASDLGYSDKEIQGKKKDTLIEMIKIHE